MTLYDKWYAVVPSVHQPVQEDTKVHPAPCPIIKRFAKLSALMPRRRAATDNGLYDFKNIFYCHRFNRICDM